MAKKRLSKDTVKLLAREWADDWWNGKPEPKSKSAKTRQRNRFNTELAEFLHDTGPSFYPPTDDDFWDSYVF